MSVPWLARSACYDVPDAAPAAAPPRPRPPPPPVPAPPAAALARLLPDAVTTASNKLAGSLASRSKSFSRHTNCSGWVPGTKRMNSSSPHQTYGIESMRQMRATLQGASHADGGGFGGSLGSAGGIDEAEDDAPLPLLLPLLPAAAPSSAALAPLALEAPLPPSSSVVVVGGGAEKAPPAVFMRWMSAFSLSAGSGYSVPVAWWMRRCKRGSDCGRKRHRDNRRV